MTPLYSDAGLTRLDAVVQTGMLCVFDFDGTLAPIVPVPDRAILPAPVLARLQSLQRVVRIAILTGRALTDITPRLNFAPDFLVGNHGLEGLPQTGQQISQFQQLCRSWKNELQQAMCSGLLADPGVMVEDKQISLSVHYRHAKRHEPVATALRALFARMTPAPRVIGGKYVFNLLPAAAGDKGTAFERLMRDSGAPSAIYVGDDATDEDVFRLQRPDLLSIKIGRSQDSSAEFFLTRHVDIVRLLDDLIQRLGGTTGKRALASTALAGESPTQAKQKDHK